MRFILTRDQLKVQISWPMLKIGEDHQSKACVIHSKALLLLTEVILEMLSHQQLILECAGRRETLVRLILELAGIDRIQRHALSAQQT